MGQVKIVQGHGADGVVIGNLGFHLNFLAILTDLCGGLRPIPGLRGHVLCENVLLVEQHLKIRLHLVDGPSTAVESSEHGDQDIGIMLDVLQIEVVFVIVVGAFIVVQV